MQTGRGFRLRYLKRSLCIAACVLLAATAHADALRLWRPDVAVATASGDQGLLRPLVVPDGSHGAFVIWWDRQRERIRIRRLGADGSSPWPASIVPAETGFGKYEPAAVSDGRGGLFVAWIEGRAGLCTRDFKSECDVYAQHIDADGRLLWSSIARPVTRAPSNQGTSGIGIAAAPDGGVYLAWEDARPDCCKVYAQRLDAGGRPVWARDGLRLSPEPFVVFGPMAYAPGVVGDGAGGALVAWIENQVDPVNGRPPLVVQRLDAQGTALWPVGGVSAGFPSTVFFSMARAPGGGALLAFTVAGVTGVHDIGAQHIGDTGEPMWGVEGVRAGMTEYYGEVPEIVRARRGGAFVAWVDHTVTLAAIDSSIRAQWISPAGEPLWALRGRRIGDAPGVQDNVRLVADGAGGSFAFWRDCRDYPDRDSCFAGADIYGQHLRHDGKALWQAQGAPVAAAAGNQSVPQGTPTRASSIAAATDGAGGAILAWPDGRHAPCTNAIWTTECNVRAQRVTDAPTTIARPTRSRPTPR